MISLSSKTLALAKMDMPSVFIDAEQSHFDSVLPTKYSLSIETSTIFSDMDAEIARLESKAEERKKLLEQQAHELEQWREEQRQKLLASNLNLLSSSKVTYKTALHNTTGNATYLGRFKLTFYCPCVECSEQYGTNTSTGVTAIEGVTVAVDPTVIPYGTRLFIDGFGEFIAQDCGGAIKQNRIDIYVTDHQRCLDLGVKYADVYAI